MIAFLNEFGYTIWAILGLLIFYVIMHKYYEGPPSAAEQAAIMESIEYRSNTFLSKTTESKWGQD